MPKSQFNLAGYALVADRITEFYERFSTGRIVTHLISRDETIVFRAEVRGTIHQLPTVVIRP